MTIIGSKKGKITILCQKGFPLNFQSLSIISKKFPYNSTFSFEWTEYLSTLRYFPSNRKMSVLKVFSLAFKFAYFYVATWLFHSFNRIEKKNGQTLKMGVRKCHYDLLSIANYGQSWFLRALSNLGGDAQKKSYQLVQSRKTLSNWKKSKSKLTQSLTMFFLLISFQLWFPYQYMYKYVT